MESMVEVKKEPVDEMDVPAELIQPAHSEGNPNMEVKKELPDSSTDEEMSMPNENTYDEPFGMDSDDQDEDIQIKDEITIEESKISFDDSSALRDYRCRICGFYTKTFKIYRTHLKVNHSDTRETRCNICLERFQGETPYRKHIQDKHEGFERMCKICLELHSVAKKKHKCAGRVVFSCKTCDFYYGKKESLWKHLDDHNISDECKETSVNELRLNEQFFSCIHCADYKLYRKDPYQKHLKDFHKGRGIQCAYCSKSFKGARNRTKHMSICEAAPTEGDIQCPDCPMSFPTQCRLNYHKKTEHQDRNRCKYCSKFFPYLNNLRRHESLHQNERKFTCNLCSLSFNTGQYLINHNRSCHQTGELESVSKEIKRERKFKCGECPRSFTNAWKLTTHEKCHRSEKLGTHYCKECNISFTSDLNLQAHVRNTIAHRKVECMVCKIVFTSAKKYDEHIQNKTCELT